MKKWGKRLGITLAVLLVCALFIQLWMISGSPQQTFRRSQAHEQVVKSPTPTLLIPGWGGGTWTYNKLIKTYQQRCIAQKTMTVWVFPSGKCIVRGQLNKRQVNPMIQLLYVWNYTPTYDPQTRQLTAVLQMLHDQYHVKRLNVIAHSYGGSELANAVLGSSRLQR